MLRRLPNRLGEHPARTSGEGIEFFGVREYVPGDRQRSINWAASTRRGRLQVNTFAAERSQDVVLLVDPTSDVGQPGSSALDLALRGAGAAARAYLCSARCSTSGSSRRCGTCASAASACSSSTC